MLDANCALQLFAANPKLKHFSAIGLALNMVLINLGGYMGRFSENMLRLYGDIMHDQVERQQLLHKLHRFAINLNKNVNEMLNNINKARMMTSDRSSKERKSFVNSLRRQIITLRRNLAEELNEIREARAAMIVNEKVITKNKSGEEVSIKIKKKSAGTAETSRDGGY